MKEGICGIFGAGEYFEPYPDLTIFDYIIAADGGYVFLENRGIKPDFVIGDFDSAQKPTNVDTVILPTEKDETDMEAAINYGLKKGYGIFYIYGGVGGRFEHTFANIQLLAYLAQKGAHGFLFDKTVITTAITNTYIKFNKSAKGYISVFAHTNKAAGVNLKGLKYTLANAVLTNAHPLGVSNEFIGVEATVSVKDGTLIIIFPKNGFK